MDVALSATSAGVVLLAWHEFLFVEFAKQYRIAPEAPTLVRTASTEQKKSLRRIEGNYSKQQQQQLFLAPITYVDTDLFVFFNFFV